MLKASGVYGGIFRLDPGDLGKPLKDLKTCAIYTLIAIWSSASGSRLKPFEMQPRRDLRHKAVDINLLKHCKANTEPKSGALKAGGG